MPSAQQEMLNHLKRGYEAQTQSFTHYWSVYSHAGTWQFWLGLALFVLPLVAVYFLIDKKRIFEVGFFGFSVHVWATYADQFGVLNGLWEYPYKLVPYTPISFLLDASIVPVAYMLTYQAAGANRSKILLYLTLLSAAFAFVFKPILSALHLFQMYGRMNFFNLFLAYLFVMGMSLLVQAVFHLIRKYRGEAAGQV